jgi:hypothetical protein
VQDLPADNWFASKHVVLLRDAPGEWPEGTRVQILVHAFDAQANTWRSEPAAFTQGTVTPIRNVGGALFLFGPPPGHPAGDLDPERARLSPGRYLLKVYVDSRQRLAKDPALLLGEDDFQGQMELNARWREGFPLAERHSAGQLRKP